MIIVAGIARSGLTVTMQMLYRGGYPCVGEWPAFEKYHVGRIPWKECEGKAVKLVEAQIQLPPDGDYQIIYLRRDLKEQAKSQKKFLEFMLQRKLGFSLKKATRSLSDDYKKIDAWAGKHPCLNLSFEDILSTPFLVAQKISEFLDIPLDKEAMAKCVIKRSPECYPGMLELAFYNGRE